MTTEQPLSDIGACVFDAYGTLLDVHSAAESCRDVLGEKAGALSALWRSKQLEYTWVRSLMGRHADFWRVTGESLDHSMAEIGVSDPAVRARLMQMYLQLAAYPDVRPTLLRLKESGMRSAILSNGSPTMLTAAALNAGIRDLLKALLSVESVGIYKPHPSVYQLACDALHLPAGRICFVSSNGWDVAGAAAFGFHAVWLNRFGRQPDHLPGEPASEIKTLDELPALIGL